VAPADNRATKRLSQAPLDWEGDLFAAGAPRSIISGTAIGRECPCGGASYLTGPGKGPHRASLECVSCGRKSWLSHADAELLQGGVQP
jgi:hypothetical protein